MTERQKVQIPKPFPAWGKARTFLEWRQNHNFFAPPGMTDEQWIKAKFLSASPGETQLKWMARLADEPVTSQFLSEIEPFHCAIGDPRHAPLGRIILPVPNLVEAIAWGDAIGRFMDARVRSLKSIGYLFDQREERQSRYGLSLLHKTIWHFAMLKLGIDSKLRLNLQGNSFLHTNTVMPDPNYVPDPLYPCYHEHQEGPWAVMVTGHKIENAIACTDGQFGPIRLSDQATEQDLENRIYEFKWQIYKAVFLVELDRGRNEAILRAFTNPELMVARGLIERPSTETVVSHIPDKKLDEKGRNVTYMKEVSKKQENHDDPIREYRAKIDQQTWEPIHFLKKLKGLDPSRISGDPAK